MKERHNDGEIEELTYQIVINTHTVEQGDCPLRIAMKYFIPDWTEIWNLEENKSLREKRSDPMCLLPGDKVHFPARRYNIRMNRPTRIRASRPESFLYTTKLLGDSGPLQGVRYKIKIPDQEPISGETDDKGVIREELPLKTFVAILTFWPDANEPDLVSKHKICFGAKDPIETLSGQQERLKNLGYGIFPSHESEDEKLEEIKKQFAIDVGLDEAFSDEQFIEKLKSSVPDVFV